MAANVETYSSSEDSEDSEDSSIDPIQVAKTRGADLKEPEKAAISRKRKIERNEAGGKKSVRGTNDPKVQQLRPNAASVEELRNFSFLDDNATIAGLVAELPRYLAVADGTNVADEEEKVQWWGRQERTLPNWSAAV
ncbi:hypothetical protein QZH41_010390, partial [Actinostola sp. cb2023]